MNRTRSNLAIPLLLAAFALVATDAAGQSAPSARPLGDTLTGEAKKAFDGGILLHRDGDFAGALIKFRQAYALSNDGRLLWNMASCEKSLRHYAKAIAFLTRFSEDSSVGDADKKSALALVGTMRGFVARLSVAVSVDGARIAVDDEDEGTSPLAREILVDLGPHRLRVEKDGFTPFVQSREFEGGTAVRVDVALEALKHLGRLVVSAGQGDTIALDGDPVGKSSWEGTAAAGEHIVRVTAPGAQPFVLTVVLRDDETRHVMATLDRKEGGSNAWIWITCAAAVVAGGAVGGYFLFKPKDTQSPPTTGTIPPGTVVVKGF
jgi:hypothetical protein